MNKNNISFPLRGVALMMAIIMFMFSCEVENSQFSNSLISQNTTRNSGLRSENIHLDNEFQAAVQNAMDFVQSRTDFSPTQIATYVSREIAKNGFENDIDVTTLSSLLNETFYVTTSNSLLDFLRALKLDEKISEKVFLLLASLDDSVQDESDDVILQTLLEFENNLVNNREITDSDRIFLNNFCSLTKNSINAMNYSTGERDWSKFVECLNRKKWLLAGAASLEALLLAVINKCAILKFDPQAMTACWLVTIGVIVTTWLLFCGGALLEPGTNPSGPSGPVVCTNPICPVEFDFSMDNGFKCCTEKGVSISAFGTNTQYLVKAPTDGDCPALWTYASGGPDGPYCWREIVGSNNDDPDNDPPRWEDFEWSQETDRVCTKAKNCP